MIQYVYVSSEVLRFSEKQLVKLLEDSRRRNTSCEVTGLLLYLSGNFIQLLEGGREEVLSTFARIAADTRHRGVNTLLNQECTIRDFKDWSMGFEVLDEEAGAKVPGYSEFLSQDTAPAAKDSAALSLLEFFKKTARR